MDGEQFDMLSKTAGTGSDRRHILQSLGGGLAGGLLAIVGTATGNAAPKDKNKKGAGKKNKRNRTSAATDRNKRKGLGAAKDKKKDDGGCCCTCPPTANECSANVCDASTGNCVAVERASGTPCNNGFGRCVHARCSPCRAGEVVCPSNHDPSLVDCTALEDPGHCGACGRSCNEANNEICRNGECVSDV